MSKTTPTPVIRLRGVRHNNLKNFDLDLPLRRLIVITGLSGSGKSTLAFDTLFAEGQRRYIETFSPYARQFFDRMDKPQVDSIEGIPPAIAIEQRNTVKSTRSTVGTMTEICDYMKVLWPQIAQLHCRQCGQPVRKDSPQRVWETVAVGRASPRAGSANSSGSSAASPRQEFLITFDLPLSEKLSLDESLTLVARQGYQRLLVDGESVRHEEAASRITHHASRITSLTVVQDRLRPMPENRARFVEACEHAYHFGKGRLTVHEIAGADAASQRDARVTQHASLTTHRFSAGLHCAQCDIDYREPTPALFSFNHPVGACPACKGFGRIITIDYDLAIPDRSKTLAEGAVKPWLTGTGAESQGDLMKFCKATGIPTNVPFERLPRKHQDWVVQGDPDYGTDEEHEWPRAWYGVKGYFRWLESKAYKMHVRVLLSRYRAYTTCPECGGNRLKPDALLYRCPIYDLRFAIGDSRRGSEEHGKSSITLAAFYQLPIRAALAFAEELAAQYQPKPSDPLGLALNEVCSRLRFLNEVGLGYLTLDRSTRSLSGGETERVNLTTCLGTGLVNTLFVLDEPSVGLHPRDTDRLVRILQRLRDAGNTVVVVEHEASVIRAADQIVDLGPGHGATGGEVVFQGAFAELLKSPASLTGQYLSCRRRIEIPSRRAFSEASTLTSTHDEREQRGRGAGEMVLQEASPPFSTAPLSLFNHWLRLTGATRHNLKDLTVEIPLKRFVCVTGVSGSGKTTLIREVLLPALETNLKSRISNLKSPGDENENEDEHHATRNTQHATRLTGHEHLGRVILVDQSPLSRTPRSNPAVYIGAFDEIRELFAQTDLARQRGLNASAFSFNSARGQCERCRGAGFEKIEMQFLSDVFIRCPDCDGRRYRPHILEVKLSPEPCVQSPKSAKAVSLSHRMGEGRGEGRTSRLTSASIADVLDATVDEVIDFLAGFAESKPARRASASLELLQDVGLGYLRLGQPINTLSGGESQRLKLVRHLAEAQIRTGFQPVTDSYDQARSVTPPIRCEDRQDAFPALFLFDEPTTGLHFDDVRVLLQVFQRLVDAGHSVVVIEHNLDVIKTADWVIDLGPDAGDQGGQLVAVGTPEEVAACEASHTGRFLRDVLAETTREKVRRSSGEKKSRIRQSPFPLRPLSPLRARSSRLRANR